MYVFLLLGLPGVGRPIRLCAKAGEDGLPDGRVMLGPSDARFGEENDEDDVAEGRFTLLPLE